MKTVFALLTLFTITVAAFAEEEPVGRYQLLSGVFEIQGKGGVTIQAHAVFRIDSKTGRTSVYTMAAVGKDGKLKEYWSDVPEIVEKDH